MAAGVVNTTLRTNFGSTTTAGQIAAVRSKNEFLEVPLKGRWNIFSNNTHKEPEERM